MGRRYISKKQRKEWADFEETKKNVPHICIHCKGWWCYPQCASKWLCPPPRQRKLNHVSQSCPDWISMWGPNREDYRDPVVEMCVHMIKHDLHL